MQEIEAGAAIEKNVCRSTQIRVIREKVRAEARKREQTWDLKKKN